MAPHNPGEAPFLLRLVRKQWVSIQPMNTDRVLDVRELAHEHELGPGLRLVM